MLELAAGELHMPSGVYERKPKSLKERLFAKCEPDPKSGCWNWRGATQHSGHGHIFAEPPGRRSVMAHRASWEIIHGPIPEGLCILHKCDNPRCINPDHLCLGTKADNSQDMVSKRRQKRGSELPHSKLTVEDVRLIRASRDSESSLALRYGVAQSTIHEARTGLRYWKYVGE
jgi:hypothetical protein